MSMIARGKTTPASTGGSFKTHAHGVPEVSLDAGSAPAARLSTYERMIHEALDGTTAKSYGLDPADRDSLRLVESFMRAEIGTLDHLSRPQFDRLAATSADQVIAWAKIGAVDTYGQPASPEEGGLTLADYCAAEGITMPEALSRATRSV